MDGERNGGLEKAKERGKLYQDELYGTKVLTPLATAIIDTPEYQRLAGLKQLGFADLVYRGATHTRLSHSIGTYLLARTIMRRIVQNHERFELSHPGNKEEISDCFRVLPPNAYEDDVDSDNEVPTSPQSRWRGLTEVVSAAALLHDVAHVPFGHTLEDEFAGFYQKHDSLDSPRLYEMMFNQKSKLRTVFSDQNDQWIPRAGKTNGIKNEDLGMLIYVILSWKEEIDPPTGFEEILRDKLNKLSEGRARERIDDLKAWYERFRAERMFHPFMSDIIGNTICADLLDYLPRDRMNLGMEWRRHDRLQRYLTIKKGTLYEEGLRVSIMVTRTGHGGQRRDVATAVLDIMRERYEMAERVFYHHKKAAASAMLARLAELSSDRMPKDSGQIYPAPWNLGETKESVTPHPIHFSDASFVDHLGVAPLTDERGRTLQRRLYVGLRHDRQSIYRTLLVVDNYLADLSNHPKSYFAMALRANKSGKPSNEGRRSLETELAAAAKATGLFGKDQDLEGEVLVYCPSPTMQSKEVNARMEIVENRILPLSVQKESFAYHADVRVLQQYYDELWRMYIFVSPTLYLLPRACQAIVDKFCEKYGIEKVVAYSKVRRHKFKLHDVDARKGFEPLRKFIDKEATESSAFDDIPSALTAKLLTCAENDEKYWDCLRSGEKADLRVGEMFQIVALESRLPTLPAPTRKKVRDFVERLRRGEISRLLVARDDHRIAVDAYVDALVAMITKTNAGN